MRLLEVYSLTNKILASQNQWTCVVQAHYYSSLKNLKWGVLHNLTDIQVIKASASDIIPALWKKDKNMTETGGDRAWCPLDPTVWF